MNHREVGRKEGKKAVKRNEMKRKKKGKQASKLVRKQTRNRDQRQTVCLYTLGPVELCVPVPACLRRASGALRFALVAQEFAGAGGGMCICVKGFLLKST